MDTIDIWNIAVRGIQVVIVISTLKYTPSDSNAAAVLFTGLLVIQDHLAQPMK